MPLDPVADLRADCTRCVGLCCTALALTRSADFPIDKPAGVPCGHLDAADRCAIHDRLRSTGYVGCTVFDCFGAGQHVTARFEGRSWRDGSRTAEAMFAAFGVARQLAELRWYLAEVLATASAEPVHAQAAALDATTRQVLDTDSGPEAVGPHREAVARVLREAARLVRSAVAQEHGVRNDLMPDRDRAGADLVGAKLAGANLRSVDFRGAALLGADLRSADLAGATLLGADLRGARLAGARLARAFLVTSPQVAAARGDATTTLPEWVARPAHWG